MAIYVQQNKGKWNLKPIIFEVICCSECMIKFLAEFLCLLGTFPLQFWKHFEKTASPLGDNIKLQFDWEPPSLETCRQHSFCWAPKKKQRKGFSHWNSRETCREAQYGSWVGNSLERRGYECLSSLKHTRVQRLWTEWNITFRSKQCWSPRPHLLTLMYLAFNKYLCHREEQKPDSVLDLFSLTFGYRCFCLQKECCLYIHNGQPPGILPLCMNIFPPWADHSRGRFARLMAFLLYFLTSSSLCSVKDTGIRPLDGLWRFSSTIFSVCWLSNKVIIPYISTFHLWFIGCCAVTKKTWTGTFPGIKISIL